MWEKEALNLTPKASVCLLPALSKAACLGASLAPGVRGTFSKPLGVTVGQGVQDQPGRLSCPCKHFLSSSGTQLPTSSPSAAAVYLAELQSIYRKGGLAQSSPGNGRSNLVVKAWAAQRAGDQQLPQLLPRAAQEDPKEVH